MISFLLALILGGVGPVKAAVPQSDAGLFKIPGPWTDDRNQTIYLKQFTGHWVVATMAYAHCRGICGTTVESLQKIEAELGEKREHLEVILFSIDPRQDSAEDMHSFFVKKNVESPRWHFLSGRQENAKRVALALGMPYGQKSARGSHIMHTLKLALISPNGSVVKVTDFLDTASLVKELRARIASP